MATIASGMITLNSVNDAFSVSLSPSSCVINAKWNGDDPDYSNAYSDITVYRGEEKVAYTYSIESFEGINIPPVTQIIDQYTTRFKLSEITSGALSGNIKIKLQVRDEFTTTVTLTFTVVRETSMLDWILDWEGREKTEIAGEHIITPKIFVGKSENGGQLTGTYIGPAFDGSGRIGVFGYSEGNEIFHLDNTGGMIGGWEIQDGGIQTSDGYLKILSEGTIISAPDNTMAWQLNKDGSASFAGGKANFYNNGDADFEGVIKSTSGEIGGWKIGEHSLRSQSILIDSVSRYIGIYNMSTVIYDAEPSANQFHKFVKVYGGVAMFYDNGNAYGLEGWLPCGSVANIDDDKKVFSLGSQNRIAGWNFDNNALYLGTKNNTAKQTTSAGGFITIGTAGIRGRNWYIDTDGEISFVGGLLHFDKDGGTIAGWSMSADYLTTSSVALVSKSGYTGAYFSSKGNFVGGACTSFEQITKEKGGIFIRTNSVNTVMAAYNSDGMCFQLSSTGLSKIAGWWFNDTKLFTGTKAADAGSFATDGNITMSPEGIRGYQWRLEADGSGAIAGGNISWKADGTVTFTPSVSLNWNNIAGALGNNFTRIDGNTIYTGSLNADNITSGKLKADRIDADELFSVAGKWALLRDGSGYLASKNISWDTKGKLKVEGEIVAPSGQIAGFKISGESLTNIGFDNDACIIFRNDAHNIFGAMGGNTLPASSGLRAVARFENNDSTGMWFSQNIALYLSAQNGTYNHAFTGIGNGTLNGWIAGFRFDRFVLAADNTIYSDFVNLNKNNHWLCKATGGGSGIALPRLFEVQTALGVGQNTAFCVELIITADIGSKAFYIYGRTDRNSSEKNADGSYKQPWKTEQYPVFVHWDGARWERQELGAGDTFHLWLVYDPDETQTLDGYTCKYTARCINKMA